MGNSKYLACLIGIATVISYFNSAYCMTLIGPTLLDLIQLVIHMKNVLNCRKCSCLTRKTYTSAILIGLSHLYD